MQCDRMQYLVCVIVGGSFVTWQPDSMFGIRNRLGLLPTCQSVT